MTGCTNLQITFLLLSHQAGVDLMRNCEVDLCINPVLLHFHERHWIRKTSGSGPEVDLRWLTADLLILIWIRTITEITAPTWSSAKNRRWISVDLTCLEQPGMSWITMERSAVVTAATANWVSAALDGTEWLTGDPKLDGTATHRTRRGV